MATKSYRKVLSLFEKNFKISEKNRNPQEILGTANRTFFKKKTNHSKEIDIRILRKF